MAEWHEDDDGPDTPLPAVRPRIPDLRELAALVECGRVREQQQAEWHASDRRARDAAWRRIAEDRAGLERRRERLVLWGWALVLGFGLLAVGVLERAVRWFPPGGAVFGLSDAGTGRRDWLLERR